MRDLKVPLVVAVFLGVVLLGLGARTLYFQKRVVDPLAAVANEVPGVLSLEVVPAARGGNDVVATLDDDVALEQVYVELDALAANTLGRSYGRLILKDRRSPELEERFYALHFFIQEGISTGRFATMAEQIEARFPDKREERQRIFVGDHHVFVQLHAGEHYLYEVIPRPAIVVANHGGSKGGLQLW